MFNNSDNRNLKLIGNIIKSVSFPDIGNRDCNAILTGFPNLDEQINGIQSGQLTTVVGRPLMGKTDFVLTIMRNIAFASNTPILYYNPRMTSDGFVYKLFANDNKIPFYTLWDNKLTAQESKKILDESIKWDDRKLYLEIGEELTTEEICAITEEGRNNYGIKILIIDYIQSIRSPQHETDEDLLPIIESFKRLALKLDIAIVLVSSYDPFIRNSFISDGKKPSHYEIKDSGSIGLSDTILWLHRPDYYNVLQDDKGNDLRGIVRIYIATKESEIVKECYLSYDVESGRFDNCLQDFNISNL